MARCIIIGPLYQGEEKEWISPQPDDFLICADGGYAAATKHGFVPHLTIGDFDSMPQEQARGEIVTLPVHKDDTDLVVCIRRGRRLGFREFVIAGCLGGRFDHTLAAMQCLMDCAHRGERAWLCDAQNRVTVCRPGSYTFDRMDGRKLSLLAMTPEVSGVTVGGTLWELNNAALSNRYPLGCSNEWVDGQACISFDEGYLAVIMSRDQV